MTFLCILFLLVGLGLVGFGAWYAYQWDTGSGVVMLALGFFMLLLGVPMTTYHINTQIKVDALVESGHYEIVTNEDYSLKELEQFMKVGGFYLKEID